MQSVEADWRALVFLTSRGHNHQTVKPGGWLLFESQQGFRRLSKRRILRRFSRRRNTDNQGRRPRQCEMPCAMNLLGLL